MTVLGVITSAGAASPASTADSPYQRGPEPEGYPSCSGYQSSAWNQDTRRPTAAMDGDGRKVTPAPLKATNFIDKAPRPTP
jgi:hypothetical protein